MCSERASRRSSISYGRLGEGQGKAENNIGTYNDKSGQ
jgi:hypothetical protein